MFLTNVAVAAFAAPCFQVGAQDSGPKLDQKKQSPAAESNQSATSQKKNATPERAGRSAAEPMNSSVARPEMKSRGAAKQEMNSATGPAEKACLEIPRKSGMPSARCSQALASSRRQANVF
jgi:hypothetical protein